MATTQCLVLRRLQAAALLAAAVAIIMPAAYAAATDIPTTTLSTTASTSNEFNGCDCNERECGNEKRPACQGIVVHQYVGPRHGEPGRAHDTYEKGNYRAALATAAFTGLMFGATLGLIYVGWKIGSRQIDLMNGSLRATEEAANAAAAGARHTQQALEHARLAERAWIAVSLKGHHGLDKLKEARGKWPARAFDIFFINVRLRFENGGKTVARVAGFRIKLGIEDPDTLPPEPNYGSPLIQPPILLVPGTKVNEWANPLPVDPVSFGQLLERKAAIVLYGVMVYKLVGESESDRPHESRFCWLGRFEVDGSVQLNLGGPPAYNRYT